MVQMLWVAGARDASRKSGDGDRNRQGDGSGGSVDRCAEKVDTRTGSLVTASDLICTIQQKTSAN